MAKIETARLQVNCRKKINQKKCLEIAGLIFTCVNPSVNSLFFEGLTRL